MPDALGITVAFLAGHPIQSTAAYWYALTFTVGGALLFAVSRSRRPRIPQEAVIGIVYGAMVALTQRDFKFVIGYSSVSHMGFVLLGLMTLNQVGLDAFRNAKGDVSVVRSLSGSPDAIVAERAKDDPQGLFSFLKTVDRKFTVKWADAKSEGSFRILNDADIASASALDQSQKWKEKDERCWEGVVPVECRSAACGTCWVGVLGGQEKLSEVQRLERKQMKVFGYNQPEDQKPFMRLACQAKAHGNVTIVIPPWNGVFGKKIYGVEESKLEPATTSAKKLRETLAAAGGAGKE